MNEPSPIEAAFQRIATTSTRGISLYSEETNDFEFHPYSDLMAQAAQVAVALEALGIGWQEKVLITAHTRRDFIITWLGLMLVGATPVPLPPKRTLAGEGAFKQRIQPLTRHHRFFLCTAEDLGDIQQVREEGSPVTAFLMEDLAAGLDAATGQQLLQRLLERGFSSRGRQLAPEDEAFIQYTSGSTGQPKGTVISLRNVLAHVRVMAEAVELEPERDTFVSWLPLYHDMGLVGQLLNCTFNTASLVMMPPELFVRRPLGFLKVLGRFGATHTVMPNFALEWVLRALATAPVPERFHLQTLKWFGVGSEPINPEALRRFQQALAPHGLSPTALSPCYGMAEATLAVSISRPGVPYKVSRYLEQVVPANGPLVGGVEVKVEPFEGSGHAGVIKVRGECISRCAYVGTERVERLDAEGFHDTHDVGFFHEGELVILGRTDEMFIINGTNYFPYDLEGVVRALPQVGARRVACFGVPQPSGRPHLVVLYEVKGASAETLRAQEEAIRTELLHKVGLRVDEVLALPPKSIPVTTSGKIQRKKALTLYQAGYFEPKRVPTEARQQSA